MLKYTLNLLISLTLTACTGSEVFAAMLQLKPGPKSIAGVQVLTGATAALDSGNVELTTVGAALRVKYIPIIGGVKIYVGQLLVSEPQAFVRTAAADALASIGKMQSVAAVFSFKYALSANQIHDAFYDVLKLNGIATDSGAIADFLKLAADMGDINKGDVMAVIGERMANGNEELHLQLPNGSVQTVSGPIGTVKQMFNFWLGQTGSDKGLQELQQGLVKGVNL